MRSLLIVRSLPIGDSERMRDLYPTAIRAHADLGHETFVLQSDAEWTPEADACARQLGATLVPEARNRPRGPGWRQTLRDPLLLGPRRRFARALQAADECFAESGVPDVITGLASTKYSGVPGYLLATRYGVPLVVWEHLTHYQRPELSWPSRLRARRTLEHCDRLVTVSEPLLANIRSCLRLGLPHGAVLPNPIVDSFFEPPTARLNDVEHFRSGRFLCAGWTNWRDFKRVDVFLRAMARLPADDICAAIAGPVPRNAPRLLRRLGLEEQVLLLGPLARPEIHALAHQADCCVVSSDHETFGLPAVEAMAAGTPVVTTRCGGPEDLVRAPYLGRVVPRRDPEALANALLEVQRNPDAFPASRIRDHASRLYSEGPFRQYWADLYQELLPHAS
ncbi:MAG TPA: glycosyltransferase family 4 protein [Thioalkalivibrio sp.]|nr:glycosyltransferase family 4 protein [Thioalkalivibrio sp.]